MALMVIILHIGGGKNIFENQLFRTFGIDFTHIFIYYGIDFGPEGIKIIVL